MKVILYKTDKCPHCALALAYLKSKGIDVDVRNCSENQLYVEELVSKSRQRAVPVIDINNNIVIGFDKKQIDNLIS